ncbi:aminodeoxychorismate synthase component I [Emcibacter nanhaiensis]|uniref:Probable branched-chain-amino-acid aminotransferase n=1 Tax=Emcibacter nanhaiensis TaxID=1505037 RepID=A0A501PB43_9PROT|nr:aminodeoxychorismate synthase component I [Emcibacter nanhaiensis]TPD57445.1 aminodeoxychorismate synthase component I [Emcibacter nanhaiensis]
MPEKQANSKNKKFTVYLDNSLDRDAEGISYRYEAPEDLIVARRPDDLEGAFERMEEALDSGRHLAGYVSYEAGLVLEERLQALVPQRPDIPYVCMGVYAGRKKLFSGEMEENWPRETGGRDGYISGLHLNISREDYLADIARIHDYLRAGDVYQVNYTLQALFEYNGPSRALYSRLRRAQPVSYGAFIESDDFDILSFSPELFLKKTGDRVVTKPMKGTIRRGRTLEEDEALADFIRDDEKSRAENLMIVDLIRNDLSKLARPGSVRVDSLFDVEKYRTLLQMTSTVEAELDEQVRVTDLLRAMFPCGSVTGAPKIRAMEIIHELERGPRGIYTGAIGYITPDRDLCFNVPIRTLMIDHQGRGCLGIGGGIVADSDAGAEYEECLLKASFLTREQADFEILETMLWTEQDGIGLLGRHLDRLEKSASYFDFPCDREAIRQELGEAVSHLAGSGPWRVRLLLSPKGNWSITCEKTEDMDPGRKYAICLAEEKADSSNSLLYHKTTARALYNRELAQARGRGCFEVIFQNENGELTEGSFTNLFVELDGRIYTPPLSAGLLPGTLRQDLLDQGKVTEKSLRPEDLQRASRIFVGNSVRGLVEVELAPAVQG